MMPSLLIVHVQSLERAVAADKAHRALCGATDMSVEHRALPDTQQKFEDVGLNHETASKWQLGGKLGGGTDMSAKHRALPDTRLKLEDAGISRHQVAVSDRLYDRVYDRVQTL